MSNTTPGNATPKLGQLFIDEHLSQEGKPIFLSLCFIDEEPGENTQWMYSEIASIDYETEPLQVYTGFEAGGMKAESKKLATDEDLSKFVSMIKAGEITEDSPSFQEWLDNVNQDSVLLQEEKDRINKLTQ